MNDKELKPCPFCGGEAELCSTGVTAYVRCNKCKSTSAAVTAALEICAVDETIKIWNSRTNCPECIKE